MIPYLQSKCQASEIKIYDGLHFLIPKCEFKFSFISAIEFWDKGQAGDSVPSLFAFKGPKIRLI